MMMCMVFDVFGIFRILHVKDVREILDFLVKIKEECTYLVHVFFSLFLLCFTEKILLEYGIISDLIINTLIIQ